MSTNGNREYLSLNDLKKHSIWEFREDDDLLYAVEQIDDLSGVPNYDVRVRVNFFSPCGARFFGYIVGIKNIFSIRILMGQESFSFNVNLPENYEDNLSKISSLIGEKLTISDFSPLRYVADIDVPGIENFEGEIDLLMKVTNKERLEGAGLD